MFPTYQPKQIFAGFLIAAFCAISIAPNPGRAETEAARYVLADVVTLRATPSADGKILGYLRIGTSLRVLPSAPEDWAKVSVAGMDEVQGYVAAAFIGTAQVGSHELSSNYRRALDGGDLDWAKRAAERLVALEPYDPKHMERLKTVHDRLGDIEASGRLADHLAGKGTKFIGYCVRNSKGELRAVLLAEYRPGSGLVSWVGGRKGVGGTGMKEKLLRLKLLLQRGPLFSINLQTPAPYGRNLIRGASLLRAEALDQPDDEATGNIEMQKLLLFGHNSCKKDGIIYSNERIQHIATKSLNWSQFPDLLPRVMKDTKDMSLPDGDKLPVYGLWAQHILNGPPLLSIEVGVDAYPGRHSRLVDMRRGLIWRLFDETSGKPLSSIGNYSGEDHVLGVQVSWISWERSGARVAIVEYAEHREHKGGGGKSVRVVVVEPDGTVHSQDIRLDLFMIM